MELLAIKVPLIRPGDDLVSIFLEEIAKQGISIRDQDIIVISSKIVAMMQKRVVRLASIKPSHRAKTLSKELNLDSRLMELILKESNHVYGGIPKLLLTLKYNLITPNAGIDLKNAPMGFVALLPLKPFEVASSINEQIFKRVGKNVGVIIVDSRINPLRMGTTGMAIGVAGFDPVVDYRGKKDLYNKPISFTRHSMADDLASAAHALMGEANERIPIAIVRDAPVKVKGKKVDPESMEISKEECLFSRAFRL
ncbi:MAG: coenzyme F420-0:L-glutamate ligase [Candidatus Bathyarchaeia archaeon]